MPASDIVRLEPANLAQLEALLCQNKLPTQDCAEQVQNFYGIFDDEALIAAGGLEPANACALLRSVVVKEQFRSSGLAKKISTYLISLAEADGREAVYLLTETAETYFERLGFSRVDRAEVPLDITQTRQFASLCPATASCMVLTISAR